MLPLPVVQTDCAQVPVEEAMRYPGRGSVSGDYGLETALSCSDHEATTGTLSQSI